MSVTEWTMTLCLARGNWIKQILETNVNFKQGPMPFTVATSLSQSEVTKMFESCEQKRIKSTGIWFALYKKEHEPSTLSLTEKRYVNHIFSGHAILLPNVSESCTIKKLRSEQIRAPIAHWKFFISIMPIQVTPLFAQVLKRKVYRVKNAKLNKYLSSRCQFCPFTLNYYSRMTTNMKNASFEQH